MIYKRRFMEVYTRVSFPKSLVGVRGVSGVVSGVGVK